MARARLRRAAASDLVLRGAATLIGRAPLSRVAIIGSCITRDLWPVRGDGVEDLLYISRTSLPSLFSRPPASFAPLPDAPAGLTRSQHRAVVDDVAKRSLEALLAFRPTHLIIDLIDERFDLISLGGAIFTDSWELRQTGYRASDLHGGQTIQRLSPTCEDLWMQAALDFAAFIDATPLREAVLILHEAQWAERYRDADGAERCFQLFEILPGHRADAARHNAMLRTYQAALRALLPDLRRVEAPQARVADERHRWGLSPFHYAPDYYETIRGQLDALGV